MLGNTLNILGLIFCFRPGLIFCFQPGLTRNKCRLMEALYGVVPYKAGPAFVRDAEDAIHKRGGYRLASLSEVAPPADEF